MHPRHLLLALALFCVAAQAVDTSTFTPREPSARERMVTARQAIDSSDWKRAIAELQTAVKAEPRNADAHNLLAYSYRKSGTDLPKAFEHYNMALKLDPRHKGAHEYIGEAYLQDRQPAEAQKHLAELEKICGNRTCDEYQELSKAIADYKARNQ